MEKKRQTDTHGGRNDHSQRLVLELNVSDDSLTAVNACIGIESHHKQTNFPILKPAWHDTQAISKRMEETVV